jgi:hypothetical protein
LKINAPTIAILVWFITLIRGILEISHFHYHFRCSNTVFKPFVTNPPVRRLYCEPEIGFGKEDFKYT